MSHHRMWVAIAATPWDAEDTAYVRTQATLSAMGFVNCMIYMTFLELQMLYEKEWPLLYG